MHIIVALLVCLQLAACATHDVDPAAAPDGGAATADAAVDHPPPACDDPDTHLRGTLEGVQIIADLCDFQYALMASDPWANWTRFEDGALILAGDVNIFRAPEATVRVRAGLIRMPGITAAAGRVYCGLDAGSYYEARDDSSPDTRLVLPVTGYAGACGGTGDGTLDLTFTYTGDSVVRFSLDGATVERTVGGVVGDGEAFSFFLEDGFLDLDVATPLVNGEPGESAVARATIALRDGAQRVLLGCGDMEGTLAQTVAEQGDEYTLRLSGLAPWIDCGATTPATGELTLTYDPPR